MGWCCTKQQHVGVCTCVCVSVCVCLTHTSRCYCFGCCTKFSCLFAEDCCDYLRVFTIALESCMCVWQGRNDQCRVMDDYGPTHKAQPTKPRYATHGNGGRGAAQTHQGSGRTACAATSACYTYGAARTHAWTHMCGRMCGRMSALPHCVNGCVRTCWQALALCAVPLFTYRFSCLPRSHASSWCLPSFHPFTCRFST